MKKTYGQKVFEHRAKGLHDEDDVIEYRRKLERDVLKELDALVEKTRHSALYMLRDFYVVMLTKTEKIGRVPRTYFLARMSCPTPVYKQSVWKYHHTSGELEYLWTIPDSILYHHILGNQDKYLVDNECKDIARFVILMESGELLSWVKRENGEKKDAVIKINKECPCQMN